MRKQNRRLENQRVSPNYLTTYSKMSVIPIFTIGFKEMRLTKSLIL